jgi:hypothetical protein
MWEVISHIIFIKKQHSPHLKRLGILKQKEPIVASYSRFSLRIKGVILFNFNFFHPKPLHRELSLGTKFHLDTVFSVFSHPLERLELKQMVSTWRDSFIEPFVYILWNKSNFIMATPKIHVILNIWMPEHIPVLYQ